MQHWVLLLVVNTYSLIILLAVCESTWCNMNLRECAPAKALFCSEKSQGVHYRCENPFKYWCVALGSYGFVLTFYDVGSYSAEDLSPRQFASICKNEIDITYIYFICVYRREARGKDLMGGIAAAAVVEVHLLKYSTHCTLTEYFHFILLYYSILLHFGIQFSTFYSTTFILQIDLLYAFRFWYTILLKNV